MQYWVNIHHPRIINPEEIKESRSIQCRVYLQERSSKKRRPSVGDRVFIYETEALSGKTRTLIDENGRHRAELGQGFKGIIALVEITEKLKEHPHKWNDTDYVGSYKTKEIKTKKKKVKLDEINHAYSAMGIPNSFNPRTYTGLRILKPDEIRALSRLMGV